MLDHFSGSPGEFRESALKAIGIIIQQLIVTFVYQSAIGAASERIGEKLKKKIFNSLLRKDMEFYDYISTGSAISQMSHDANTVHQTLKHLITNGCKGIGQVDNYFSSSQIAPKTR